MPDFPMPPEWVTSALRAGLVIPAHPLALTSNRKLDERYQRALTRYYHAAGAGGLAVGVHTTQFAIRNPKHDLLKPVLQLAKETISECDRRANTQTVRIAGICGLTNQAIAEATLARDTGFHAGLLSLAALKDASDEQLITHSQTVAQEIPLVGFYLQPAVGGRVLSASFWRRFCEIPNVIAIKIAPFNRYQTLEVIRAVAETGRANDIALYTGNDDNIVLDLLTEYRITPGLTEFIPPPLSPALNKKEPRLESWERPAAPIRIVGGLLGHWACWTQKSADLLASVKAAGDQGQIPANLLTLAAQITDANSAFFDAANQFAGCIPGIHEVLRRQGLLQGIWCLDPNETLSPGQAEEIDRIYQTYPHLHDDPFVRENLDQWLKG